MKRFFQKSYARMGTPTQSFNLSDQSFMACLERRYLECEVLCSSGNQVGGLERPATEKSMKIKFALLTNRACGQLYGVGG